jgi:hypothetical protein
MGRLKRDLTPENKYINGPNKPVKSNAGRPAGDQGAARWLGFSQAEMQIIMNALCIADDLSSEIPDEDRQRLSRDELNTMMKQDFLREVLITQIKKHR